jgi:hypothetical protein
MRFAVEYTTKSGMVGLIIFSARDMNSAQIYMEELITYHGHDHVYNLNELTEGTVAELFRLYPRIANVTVRGNIPVKGHD